MRIDRALPVALLLCVVLACAESSKPRPSTTSTAPNSTPEAPTVTVSAPDLYAAYQANEVAADEAYKKKILRITGKIDNIGKDIIDTMYVTLSSGERYGIGSVQCMFADEHKAELVQLRKGEAVTLIGLCDGKLGNVIVRDCHLEK